MLYNSHTSFYSRTTVLYRYCSSMRDCIYSYLVVVVEEVARERLHFLGPGGAPHESLPVRADLAHDLADLGFEPHVKHAVCLIQNLFIRWWGRKRGGYERKRKVGAGLHASMYAARAKRRHCKVVHVKKERKKKLSRQSVSLPVVSLKTFLPHVS